MKRSTLIITAIAMLAIAQNGKLDAQAPQTGAGGQNTPVQGGEPVASFKSSVDLVRVSAVVRDRKGRFVRDLRVGDFDILDDGQARPITGFRHDVTGVSIAVLFDVSGSMEARIRYARESAAHLLSWLDAERDEAAVFTFDTRLAQMTPFTRGLHADELIPLSSPLARHSPPARLDGREGGMASYRVVPLAWAAATIPPCGDDGVSSPVMMTLTASPACAVDGLHRTRPPDHVLL